MRAGHTVHTFTFLSERLHLQKVIEAASTLLDRHKKIKHWNCHQNRIVKTDGTSRFDTSKYDAAKVYKVQQIILREWSTLSFRKLALHGNCPVFIEGS